MIRVWSEPTLKLKLETLHITSSTIAPLAIFDDFYKNREVGGVVDSIHRSTRAAPIEIPTFQMLRCHFRGFVSFDWHFFAHPRPFHMENEILMTFSVVYGHLVMRRSFLSGLRSAYFFGLSWTVFLDKCQSLAYWGRWLRPIHSDLFNIYYLYDLQLGHITLEYALVGYFLDLNRHSTGTVVLGTLLSRHAKALYLSR